MLLHSGIDVYSFEPVNRSGRGSPQLLQVDFGRLDDGLGPIAIKIIVSPAPRLSSRQFPAYLVVRRFKRPRCWQFCLLFSMIRTSTHLIGRREFALIPTQHRLRLPRAQSPWVCPKNKKSGDPAIVISGLRSFSAVRRYRDKGSLGAA